MPSAQDLMGALRQADAAGDTAGAQRIAAMIKQVQNPDGAIAGEPDLGGAGNAALAGGIGFVHNLPLIGDASITAGRWANDHLNGRDTSWQQANAEAHQTVNSASDQHPIASTVGGIGGAIDTGVAGGEVLGMAGEAGVPGANALRGALALRKGQLVANAGRIAAVGAAGGAAQAGGEELAGGNVAQALPAAVGGAVVGGGGALLTAGLGRVGLGVARRAFSLPAKTALALSKVFGENPSDLQTAFADHNAATGRPPSMAEMATYKQQGLISGLAKDSAPIGGRLQARAVQAAQDRSQTMQANFAPPQPSAPVGQTALPLAPGAAGATSGEISNATTTQGDADYDAARQHDFQIPTEDSAALGGVSPADHLAASVVPLAGLKTADKVRIMDGLKDGNLSGQDAQMLQRRLGAAQGTGSNYSPAVSTAQGDLADILQSPGNEQAHAALSNANANYAAGSQRAAGAAHGETILGSQTAPNFAAESVSKPNDNPNFTAGLASGGRAKLADAVATPQGATSIANRLASDDSLHAKIASVYGAPTADSLRRLGTAESATASALAPYNRAAPAEDGQQTAKDAAQVIAAAATHGIGWKAFHVAKLLSGVDMSDAVQSKVADYLTDPKMAPQGVALLQKAGASAQMLRGLALHAAGATGIIGGSAVGSTMESSQ